MGTFSVLTGNILPHIKVFGSKDLDVLKKGTQKNKESTLIFISGMDLNGVADHTTFKR